MPASSMMLYYSMYSIFQYRTIQFHMAMLGRSKTTVSLEDMSQTQARVARPTKNFQKMRNSITADIIDTFRTNLKTMRSMKSVRFHGSGDIRVEDIDEPVCGRGEVKVLRFFDK